MVRAAEYLGIKKTTAVWSLVCLESPVESQMRKKKGGQKVKSTRT